MRTESPPSPDVVEFEEERNRLLGIAYRITGSRTEADDIVQEAWLRWSAADRNEIVNPPAWLTTVTSRIALDRLKSAQHRREEYVGPWLPEVTGTIPGPDESVELAESVTIGFLTVLERLQPVERAVFVLSEVFDVPFAEIADVVGKRADACRQIATRARRRVRDDAPPWQPTADTAWEAADAFARALREGDMTGVLRVLAPDVLHMSDGGADHRAARQPVIGAERVGRFFVKLAGRYADTSIEPRLLNGQPGAVVTYADGTVATTMVFSVVDGSINRVWAVVNPDKLGGLDAAPIW